MRSMEGTKRERACRRREWVNAAWGQRSSTRTSGVCRTGASVMGAMVVSRRSQGGSSGIGIVGFELKERFPRQAWGPMRPGVVVVVIVGVVAMGKRQEVSGGGGDG